MLITCFDIIRMSRVAKNYNWHSGEAMEQEKIPYGIKQAKAFLTGWQVKIKNDQLWRLGKAKPFFG